ncbi:MAG: hydrogenase maturation protease [Myxococcaceae bacterium]
MSRPARVIGVGQRMAGDDGAGLAVIDVLRRRGVPEGLELIEVAEPSALIPLLTEPGDSVLVDAVLGAPAGEVLELSSDELARCAALSLPCHGVGLAEAVQLARLMARSPASGEVRLVAIRIHRPRRQTTSLSPAVAAGVLEAAERILAQASRPSAAVLPP